MTERLFKASEYKEAEAAHKRENPRRGDYWWEDHFCPVLVVLAVANDFVTVSRKTKDVDDKSWTWDLTQPEILSRAEFNARLEKSRPGGSHLWAANAFERGKSGEPVDKVAPDGRRSYDIPDSWIHGYVDKMLGLAKSCDEGGAMRAAISLRAEHVLDLVVAYRDYLNCRE